MKIIFYYIIFYNFTFFFFYLFLYYNFYVLFIFFFFFFFFFKKKKYQIYSQFSILFIFHQTKNVNHFFLIKNLLFDLSIYHILKVSQECLNHDFILMIQEATQCIYITLHCIVLQYNILYLHIHIHITYT